MHLLFYFAIGFTVFCLIALVMAPFVMGSTPESTRVMEVVSQVRLDESGMRPQPQDKLLQLAKDMRARLGLSDNPKLKARLASAGLRDPNSADMFFAAQFLTPLAGAFAGSFIPVNTLFWVAAIAAVGYLAPDMWLTMMTKRRTKRIRRSIPDALDLLTICIDAGLGMDQALLRVGEEIAVSYPDINEEFTQVNLEQKAGKPRLEAWQSMATRTQIEEFSAFVSMLTQSDRFGTPIIKALTRFSEELRVKRRQHAEEAAAKTKIKIIFPLVLFIFPCIFIVLLAPAIMSIASGLKAMGN